MRPFVAEQAAFDALLSVVAIFSPSPRKGSVAVSCAQDDLVSRADNEVRRSLGLPAAVVTPVEVADGQVAVLCEPPQRTVSKGSISPTLTLLRLGGGAGLQDGDAEKAR